MQPVVTQPVLLPIGHSLGGAAEAAGAVYRVRVGPDVVRMPENRFTIWALAHGSPGDGPVTVDAVLGAAGLPDGGDLLAGLVDDGLLALVGPGADDPVAFARTHRLEPLMLGLGNVADDPDTYEIGLPGQPVARVGAVLYAVFSWGHLENTLWDACRVAAADAPDELADPRRLLDALLDALPALLAPNAARLDRV
ncbi:hypothetical protein [Cryptosporangium aurantiacum]|uniref:Uncharacterized protein n=1 Tax=Cryptosporangium aurantiacum TaxID=134849 RepID=A0A1M7TXE5_9ACTN|nr:hypothetical protein [Cryptosporangium aurantiacum]SHN75388.1 hypothetical protein SAMN05443668_107285 [Cryptosporangium aurantiacum]